MKLLVSLFALFGLFALVAKAESGDATFVAPVSSTMVNVTLTENDSKANGPMETLTYYNTVSVERCRQLTTVGEAEIAVGGALGDAATWFESAAECYVREGDSAAAQLQWYAAIQALEEATQRHNVQDSFDQHLGLVTRTAHAYDHVGDHEKMLQKFQEARQDCASIAPEKDETRGYCVGNIYLLMAEHEVHKGRPDAAKPFYSKAGAESMSVADKHSLQDNHKAAYDGYWTAADFFESAGDSASTTLARAKSAEAESKLVAFLPPTKPL